MLPALMNYVPGVAFEGTRDVRVTDRAKTLQVAIWLHRLDMAAGGETLASNLVASSRPTPGVIFDSEDQQPHFPGGC